MLSNPFPKQTSSEKAATKAGWARTLCATPPDPGDARPGQSRRFGNRQWLESVQRRSWSLTRASPKMQFLESFHETRRGGEGRARNWVRSCSLQTCTLAGRRAEGSTLLSQPHLHFARQTSGVPIAAWKRWKQARAPGATQGPRDGDLRGCSLQLTSQPHSHLQGFLSQCSTGWYSAWQAGAAPQLRGCTAQPDVPGANGASAIRPHEVAWASHRLPTSASPSRTTGLRRKGRQVWALSREAAAHTQGGHAELWTGRGWAGNGGKVRERKKPRRELLPK